MGGSESHASPGSSPSEERKRELEREKEMELNSREEEIAQMGSLRVRELPAAEASSRLAVRSHRSTGWYARETSTEELKPVRLISKELIPPNMPESEPKPPDTP